MLSAKLFCLGERSVNMKRNIPTYSLENLSEFEDDVFLLFNQKVENPKSAVNVPFRSNYFGVGICVRGNAELKANLETYTVEPNCVVAMSPQIIKQWTFMSDDFEISTVFFTSDFISTGNHLNLDIFPFFESVADHAFQLTDTQSKIIVESLDFIRRKYDAPHPFRNEILKNLINVLLYETAAIYDRQSLRANQLQTRSQSLASDFKKLVNIHFAAERSVKFYAAKLFITPKHLSETVKEVTGKTAGEWIAETVILEAKILLQNPALNVAQVSDLLHFADQSTFGKFFKNMTNLSPLAYRQNL